jgi:cell wall-associated NlpC family hydrolase
MDELYRLVLSRYFGMFYQWGGSGPPNSYGIDCSGLVQKVLELADICPPGDHTADGLYRWYQQHTDGVQSARCRGALAFFGTEAHIVHVGWMIDSECVISASGGGRDVSALDVAVERNARVKIEPLLRWKNPAVLTTLLPAYPF